MLETFTGETFLLISLEVGMQRYWLLDYDKSQLN